jgi:iron(III) transport system substrate-binding protein
MPAERGERRDKGERVVKALLEETIAGSDPRKAVMKKTLWLVPLLLVGAAAGLWWGFRSPGKSQTVVVYVSHDQVFSEPILRDFEKETGIRVRAVYDTEETKSTGAMNRLIAEKNNPQADVYWANEPVRAEVLRQQRIAAPYISPNAQGIPDVFRDPQGYWTGFAARARVLIVREDVDPKPTSLFSYSDPRWRGKAVIANPLFGTTTDQVAALFVLMGDERGRAFMQGLRDNGVKISPSNGDSADLVARGQFAFSLVDSDDVINRMNQQEPVRMVYPDQGDGEIGCLIVPNAAVLIAGSPHQEAGKKLIDYLLSTETERKLAFSDAGQIPLHSGVKTPPQVKPIGSMKVMKVDYAAVATRLQAIQPFLKSWTGS